MDTAVALVQAYLHVNGYFTTTEFPVIEAFHRDHARAVTDLDVLAFCFAQAAHDLKRGRTTPSGRGAAHFRSRPWLRGRSPGHDRRRGQGGPGAIQCCDARPGRARIGTRAVRCCAPPHVGVLTRQLLREGRAITDAGHVVRLVAFGDVAEAVPATGTCVLMRHVVEYLQAYLHRHWSVLRHAQIREPTFAVLALLEKWRVATDTTLVA